MPSLVVHDHFDEDVARVHTAGGNTLFAVFHLGDVLCRNQNLFETILQSLTSNSLSQSRLGTLLHSGISVHNVPFHIGHFQLSLDQRKKDIVKKKLDEFVNDEKEEGNHDHEGTDNTGGIDRFLSGRPNNSSQFFVGGLAVLGKFFAGCAEPT